METKIVEMNDKRSENVNLKARKEGWKEANIQKKSV
jgi:hypothetical protein